MQVEIGKFLNPLDVVAVALSGGSDSMALLHYLNANAKKYGYKVVALNVEHGIRGEDSERDTEFVKDYCSKTGIPLICYQVNSLKKAKEDKLSVEQAARVLRYECFFDAIDNKKCDKIATAHHLSDNVESILFNVFRGTGVKGATGINENYQDKIIRPFLSVEKSEIESYIKENGIPFVTDRTNFCVDYTRNALRIEVIPQIEKIFPKAQKSIARFAEILRQDDDYMQSESQKAVKISKDKAAIALPVHPAIFARACVAAFKALGIEKDYEKVHIDDAYSLFGKQSGSSIDLPQGVTAIKEYDEIVFYKKEGSPSPTIPFALGTFEFGKTVITAAELGERPSDLKSGFFADLDKIPPTAVIRARADGDLFTKFGGGTKPLAEYLTDLKIPQRVRNFIPVLANGKEVLAIFGVAISDKIKVDDNTKKILSIKAENL